MDGVIVAFDCEKSRLRVKQMLEHEGIEVCACYSSASQAMRLAAKLGGAVIVCGALLGDMSANELASMCEDSCAVVVIASAVQLEMYDSKKLFKLPSPVTRSDLASSVRMLMRSERTRKKSNVPKRSDGERQTIARAKALLMERNLMSEDEAYRFMQKKSMDAGARMVDLAREILAQ